MGEYYDGYVRARKTTLIVINVIMAVIGIAVDVDQGSFGTGIFIWFFGSWIVGAILAMFTTSEGFISSAVHSVVGIFLSCNLCEFDSILGMIYLIIFTFKLSIGLMALGILFAIEMVIYPFVTISILRS